MKHSRTVWIVWLILSTVAFTSIVVGFRACRGYKKTEPIVQPSSYAMSGTEKLLWNLAFRYHGIQFAHWSDTKKEYVFNRNGKTCKVFTRGAIEFLRLQKVDVGELKRESDEKTNTVRSDH